MHRFIGRTVCGGVVSGHVVKLDEKTIEQKRYHDKIVLVDLLSSDIIRFLPKIKGLIVISGGVTSHPAIMCREMKIPTIICPDFKYSMLGTKKIELNATKGYLIYKP